MADLTTFDYMKCDKQCIDPAEPITDRLNIVPINTNHPTVLYGRFGCRLGRLGTLDSRLDDQLGPSDGWLDGGLWSALSVY